MKKLLALLLVPLRAVLHGMGVGLCVGLVLALWFSVARGLMLAYYWPTPGGELWAELPVALLMGFRFDLKMGAIATLLLFFRLPVTTAGVSPAADGELALMCVIQYACTSKAILRTT